MKRLSPFITVILSLLLLFITTFLLVIFFPFEEMFGPSTPAIEETGGVKQK